MPASLSTGDRNCSLDQNRRNQPGRNSSQNWRTAQRHDYPPASYIYLQHYVPVTYAVPLVYAPNHMFPSTHGDLGSLLPANITSPRGHQSIIPPFNGVVAWNEPVPTSYLQGNHLVFYEAPQVLEYVGVPHNGSLQHTPNSTQNSSHRRSTRDHSDLRGCPQIPALPSVSAPRGGSLPVSTGASSNSGIQRSGPTPGNNSSRVSLNAPSNPGSGIVENFPKDTNAPTSAIEQPREVEPVNETNQTQDRDFHLRISVIDEVMILDLLHHDGTEGCVGTGNRDHEQFDGRVGPVVQDITETITGQPETVQAPSTSETNNEKHSCIICLDDSKDRHGFRALNCGHRFHSKCISKWFGFKRICPICRAEAV